MDGGLDGVIDGGMDGEGAIEILLGVHDERDGAVFCLQRRDEG